MSVQTTRFTCHQKSAFGSGKPFGKRNCDGAAFEPPFLFMRKNVRSPMVCAVHPELETIAGEK